MAKNDLLISDLGIGANSDTMVNLSQEFIVEGLAISIVASVGIALNVISVFYFYKLKHQRAFHRLLLILAVVDTVHLVSSCLSFSIPQVQG